jgi:hypothetical protein
LNIGWPPDLTWYKLLTEWGSVIGGVFALIAGLAVVIIGRVQVQATRETADKQIAAVKANLQADTMLRLMDKFDTEPFQAKLKVAAEACLTHLDTKDPGVSVEDVLDFFDDAAFCVYKGALDEEMMWHPFYHWFRVYYQASEQHINVRTKDESGVWNYLRWIYPRLNELEKAKSPSTYKEKLNDTDLEKYLREICE